MFQNETRRLERRLSSYEGVLLLQRTDPVPSIHWMAHNHLQFEFQVNR